MATNRGLGHFHFRHLRSDPAPDAMCRMPLLSRRLAVRFQKRIDEGHRRLQLRSLSHRCLSLARNRTEHRLTHHPPMNPQLLGDPSNRSTAMLILTRICSNSSTLALLSTRPPFGGLSPKRSTRYMAFSKVGPNQSVEWGQIRVSKSP